MIVAEGLWRPDGCGFWSCIVTIEDQLQFFSEVQNLDMIIIALSNYS